MARLVHITPSMDVAHVPRSGVRTPKHAILRRSKPFPVCTGRGEPGRANMRAAWRAENA